jgi:hypothetical protein
MRRINEAFKWGLFLTAMFAAGARAVPGARGVKIEMLAVCLILLGFLTWALDGYIYAWHLAIRDIRARMRRARAVTVHVTYAG